jgi:hypothetical protein
LLGSLFSFVPPSPQKKQANLKPWNNMVKYFHHEMNLRKKMSFKPKN